MQNLKLYNSHYLEHLCNKYGLRPSKKYGQNFLISPEPIEVMLEAGEVKKTDTVVEVGPGFGVLTFALAEKAGKVIAFEIEKKLMPYWEEIKPPPRGGVPPWRENQENNIEIVWGNVLHVILNPDSHRDEESPGSTGGSFAPLRMTGEYKLIANLPYQITSPVIRTFLEAENPPDVMVLMVQKEVAERICAKPGQMSLLSISVQYYANAEIIARVMRNNFWPEPAVDSAIIRVIARSPNSHWDDVAIPKTSKKDLSKKEGIATVATLPRDDDCFFKIVRAGFAQKRKLLVKNLESVVGKKNKSLLVKAIIGLGLPPTARAQELSVLLWIKLAQEIAQITQK